jgi:DNA sulfur modification protein DndB
MKEEIMSTWEKISNDQKELNKLFKTRHSIHEESVVFSGQLSEKQIEGWKISKQYKNGKIQLTRAKSHFNYFEDRVWSLFQKMKFSSLNIDRLLEISYSDTDMRLKQQIDVFAMDDETIILVECKSTEKPRTSNFKTEMEAFDSKIYGIRNAMNSQFPGRKICMIWATNNYDLGEQDKNRLHDFQFVHFSEQTVQYFENLAEHLGSAAKYQLLGYLFPNKEIKKLDSVVPAIMGSMGGHTYYSFMIKPADLLKISYVLHRNNANNEMMPTYQRLIKKDRLSQIKQYINNKGYFPNSIIININEEMVFDIASQKNSSYSEAKIGLLHLPKKYRSAYIIDGQHRLYGYAETDFAEKHTIPVIAFVNLDQAEQVKMFMDINENQKSVPKILRNTLIKDLYLESKDKNEVRVALSLIVADRLGDLKKSPLFNRVLIGENKKTDTTSITLENLRIAILKNSDFFTKFSKANAPLKLGSFDFEDSDKTVNSLVDFFVREFSFIRDYNEEEWNKGTKDGFLATNNTIMALIYLLNDFINIKNLKATTSTSDSIQKELESYLFELCQVINDLSIEKKTEFKKAYGAGAPNLIHKEIGFGISQLDSTFTPEWLGKYVDEFKQNNIEESRIRLEMVRSTLVEKIRELLPIKKSISEHVDDKTFLSIEGELAKKKLRFEKEGLSFNEDYWSVLTFDLMGKIINYGSNWSNFFKQFFESLPQFGEKRARDITEELLILDKKIKLNTSISAQESIWLESIIPVLGKK